MTDAGHSGVYVGVRIEGGLLPAGLLARLATSRTPVAGHDSQDYGLAAGESVREAANRVWAYLRSAWVGYRDALERLPESDRATSLTRDRWLQILLDQLGYGRVASTPSGGITVDGKSFPVSHLWGTVPIHLLGARIELDRLTAGAAGAARQAPQSLVQELLNRSEEHLWAILSNGSTFRVLRDSTSLVGSAYVEFDLEAIFEGELFSDFLMLFTLCHATRLEVRDPEIGAASCRLEQWRGMAVEDGSRALDQLREGVVEALQGLGTGFLAHPDNAALRERVESGELSLYDFNHALLRVVYRLLFSFVAEDRGALLSPGADPHARERYAEYFSTDRLRRTARRRRGGRHGDRWQALQLVWRGLGSAEGLPELGIVGIGGLFETGDLDFLGDVSLSNEALLNAVRALSVIRERGSGQAQVVNYRDLDAEELGSIYEALLEYVPSWDGARRAYTLGTAAGNARKTTGSYYTPTSLIESLLDTALDPVLDAAEKRGAETGDPVAELLAVTVIDPACGSGHFLVGAARRIAKRVAAVRTGDPEPPPEQVRAALREVVGRCIYGVDLNPLAAELAKVSLWLDAMEPGKPLAFLDAQVKVGNALVGATPVLLDQGLPQEAFKPIEGDDKKTVAALAKRNKQETGGQGSLFGAEEARASNADLIEAAAGLVGAGLSLGDIHVQQQRLKQYADSDAYRAAKLHADAWCAAFVWPRTPTGITCPTTATLQSMLDDPERWLGPDRSAQAAAIVAEVERLAAEYRFFHWHLEFPQLFPTERPASAGKGRAHTVNNLTGWYGGFDAVLGNPPFLNQLETLTSTTRRSSALIAAAIGRQLGAYTDLSAVFLLKAMSLARLGGYVAMVQPQSLVAARDAGPVRRFAASKGALAAFWASDAPVFTGVSVLTCAPTLRIGGDQGPVTVFHGPIFQMMAPVVATAHQLQNEWSFLLAQGLGIPTVTLGTEGGVLGDLGSCTADFRDQYYGLAPFVLDGSDGPGRARLITTGLIDPATSLWGLVSTRFNKQKYEAPVVDLERLCIESDLGPWAEKRLVPKILVATQGQVIEAVADGDGRWLPSVPVLTFEPTEKERIWHALAVLCAPPVVADAAARFSGAGLTRKAIKMSAKHMATLPLPRDSVAWDEGAFLAEEAQGHSEPAERRRLLAHLAEVMTHAYGGLEDVTEWWLHRAGLAGEA